MTPKTVTCFGELLVDMIALNPGKLTTVDGFLKKFGGAPANTAAGLAKLGVPVNYICKVGADPFGEFLKQELQSFGVNIQAVVTSPTGTTTLAFVSLTEAGERDFFFIRGVHDKISPQEVELPKNTGIFHCGSLTQTKSNFVLRPEHPGVFVGRFAAGQADGFRHTEKSQYF